MVNLHQCLLYLPNLEHVWCKSEYPLVDLAAWQTMHVTVSLLYNSETVILSSVGVIGYDMMHRLVVIIYD